MDGDRFRHANLPGLVCAVGTSIHDRKRAGALAHESILDAFMLRYNAKHPGAEQDVFPHLAALKTGPLSEAEEAWVREYGRQVKAKKRMDYV